MPEGHAVHAAQPGPAQAKCSVDLSPWCTMFIQQASLRAQSSHRTSENWKTLPPKWDMNWGLIL